MENKNNDDLNRTLEKIKTRKYLFDQRAVQANEKIRNLQMYIDENDEQIESIKKGIPLCKYFAYILYIFSFFSLARIKEVDDFYILYSLYFFEVAQASMNIHLSEPIPYLNTFEALSKINHLEKENKKAEKIIFKLKNKLEKFRKGYEEKAHEDIEKLFSNENTYHDDGLEKDSSKMIKKYKQKS